MTARYVVERGSNSGHCCFQGSVVDSTTPNQDAICECFEYGDAEKIAALLNGPVPVLTDRTWIAAAGEIAQLPTLADLAGLGVVVK